VKRPTVGELALGETDARTAALALALTAWARCTDLGPAVQVHPSIRAWDAGVRE
jgi:hypothetical protein